MDTDKKPVALFFTALACMLIGPIINGWCLSLMWRWFVIPFFEIAELGIVQAIGLAIVAKSFTLTHTGSPKGERGDKQKIAECVAFAIAPLFVLGYAAIVRMFL